MTSITSTSVLAALGYQVLSLELGVYVLQPWDNATDDRIVALMLAQGAPAGDMLQVHLFLEPVPDGVAAVDIVEVWQGLNARRFEETGLVARVLELGPVPSTEVCEQAYARPDGGVRQVLELPTGDVVCLN